MLGHNGYIRVYCGIIVQLDLNIRLLDHSGCNASRIDLAPHKHFVQFMAMLLVFACAIEYTLIHMFTPSKIRTLTAT